MTASYRTLPSSPRLQGIRKSANMCPPMTYVMRLVPIYLNALLSQASPTDAALRSLTTLATSP
jgi:hypothetical protein